MDTKRVKVGILEQAASILDAPAKLGIIDAQSLKKMANPGHWLQLQAAETARVSESNEELRAPKRAPDLLLFQFSAAVRPVLTRCCIKKA